MRYTPPKLNCLRDPIPADATRASIPAREALFDRPQSPPNGSPYRSATRVFLLSVRRRQEAVEVGPGAAVSKVACWSATDLRTPEPSVELVLARRAGLALGMCWNWTWNAVDFSFGACKDDLEFSSAHVPILDRVTPQVERRESCS